MSHTKFDPAPVIASLHDLLAHHGDELRDAYHADVEACRAAERVLSMCGSCVGSGRLRLPEGRGYAPCWVCRARGIR